ncbi:MAG: hypothetical protein OXU68_05570, partial [Bacteroidota bacterium]|nr:hypothetical protein [Bacteroidota bacterium]
MKNSAPAFSLPDWMRRFGSVQFKVCFGKAVLMLGLAAFGLTAVARGQVTHEPSIEVSSPTIASPGYIDGNSWFIPEGTSVTFNVKPKAGDQQTNDFRAVGGIELFLDALIDQDLSLNISFTAGQQGTVIINDGNWDQGVDIGLNIGADADNVGGCIDLAIEIAPANPVPPPGFSGNTFTREIDLCVIDDQAGIVAFPTEIDVDEGKTATLSVQLLSSPGAGGVTVDILEARLPASASVTAPSSKALTFNSTSWRVGQTVTLDAGMDDNITDETGSLIFVVTDVNSRWYGQRLDVPVMINDNDTPGIDVPPAIAVTEGGMKAFDVVLTAQPAVDVTVTIAGHSGTGLSLDLATLTFTTTNYSTPQPVTVTAAQDTGGDQVTLTLTAAGGGFGGTSARVVVTVIDDDTNEINAPSQIEVEEESSQTFDVELTAAPSADVTVTITSSSTDLTTNPTSLTFTTTNYNTAQTVNVTALQDDDFTDDSETLTLTASGGGYSGTTTVDVTVRDDDEPAIVAPSLISVDEQVTDLFNVSLTAAPSADVMVAIAGHLGTDLTLDKTSLTFTPTNWSIAQPVTVSAADDDDSADEQVELTLTASGGGYGSLSTTVDVIIEDNDTPAIEAAPSSISIDEGDSQPFNVKLASQPSAAVTVTITGHAGTSLDPAPKALEFTASNWDTARPVTVTAGTDADFDDESVTLTLTANGGDYRGVMTEVDVTVNDETMGIVVPARVTVDEGSIATVDVSLSALPTGDVTVTISGHSGTDLTLTPNPATLTFTPGNYNSAQSVTVTAADDDDAMDDNVTLTLSSAGGGYGASASVEVTVDDDDTAAIDAPSSITLDEGTSKTFDVVLESLPSAAVTVTITGHSGTDLMLDKTSLPFTTSNWNVAQTVTVAAAMDEDLIPDEETLTLTAAGGDYADVEAEVDVTVNEVTKEIVVEPDELTVDENGVGKTYTVKLAQPPTAEVMVAITGNAGTDLTLNKTSLTFTTTDWDTAQPVTVTAGDDPDSDNDTETLTHTASSTDTDYNGETAEVEVTVQDDDPIGLVVSTQTLAVAEGGASAGYTVQLSTQPSAAVTVTITGQSGTDLTLTPDPATLTFTMSNWNMTQPVTVSAGQDDDAADDDVTLAHTATSTDTDYEGKTATVSVTVGDDDTPSLILSESSLTIPEGETKSFTVRLSALPTSQSSSFNVDIAASRVNGVRVLRYTTLLRFNKFNWSTPQRVDVETLTDLNTINETVTMVLSIDDFLRGDFHGVTASLPVTVQDKNFLGLAFDPDPLRVNEGASVDYTVKLGSRPTHDVMVTVTKEMNSVLTLSPAMPSLTFTTSNWNVAQTVTVTAATDTDPDNETEVLTHTMTSTDTDYTGTESLTVTVVDAAVFLDVSATTLTVDEGDQVTFDVKLPVQPATDVTVTITSSSTDLTPSPISLTFSPTASANLWNVAQTVTVSAGMDADFEDEDETLTLAAAGGDYDNVTRTVDVTVNDVSKGIVVQPADLTVDEGSNASFNVSLTYVPSGTVTVAIAGHSGTDLTLDKESLEFTTANWNTVQPVTVTAGADADIDDDEETLTLMASGADYAGVEAEVDVTVDDNTPGLRVSKTELTVQEGGCGATPPVFDVFELSLTERPTAGRGVRIFLDFDNPVRVALLTSSSRTIAQAGNRLYIDFSRNGWSVPEMVYMCAVEDDDNTVHETITFTLTPTRSGYNDAAPVDITVNVIDNDAMAGLVLDPDPLSVNEGASADYAVKLATPPAADVTVTISKQAGSTLTLSPTTPLTFTPTTWNDAQAVTVTAAQDPNATDETETLTHTMTSTDTDYAGTKDLSVAVVDDDLFLDVSATTLTVDEGDQVTFDVKLPVQPATDVTVTITSSSMDLTTTPTSLTFTTVNYNTAKTVTVSAVADADFADESETLTLTAAGGAYEGKTAAVAVTVNDGSKGIVVDPTDLAVDEGSNNSFDVSLSDVPSGTVTVTIAGHSGTDLTLDKMSLAFTTSNWNMAQPVMVSAGADADSDDDEVTLTLTAAGADYAGVTAEVDVTVDDNTPGLRVTKTGLTLQEGGCGATPTVWETFDLSLTVQPTHRNGARVSVGVDRQHVYVTSTPRGNSQPIQRIDFPGNTWEDPETVWLCAFEDSDTDHETITLTLTPTRGNYGGASPVNITLQVIDNDAMAGLVFDPDPLSVNEGASADYTVKLATPPVADVTMTISKQASSALTLSPTIPLMFTTTTWNDAQTVTVSAAQDQDAADETETLTHTLTSTDTDYTRTDNLAVSVVDDETAGIMLSESTLGVNEGGDNTYTVKLETQPTAEVTVAITSSGADVTTSPTSLTFTTADYNTAQTVTVSAGEDDDATNDSAMLLHTASGGDYAGETASLAVTVDDDETAGITLSVSTLGVNEGGNNTYTVKLATEPTAPVTVAITGLSGTDLMLDKTSLTFNPSGSDLWST